MRVCLNVRRLTSVFALGADLLVLQLLGILALAHVASLMALLHSTAFMTALLCSRAGMIAYMAAYILSQYIEVF
jgi:hypothetical protein